MAQPAPETHNVSLENATVFGVVSVRETATAVLTSSAPDATSRWCTPIAASRGCHLVQSAVVIVNVPLATVMVCDAATAHGASFAMARISHW